LLCDLQLVFQSFFIVGRFVVVKEGFEHSRGFSLGSAFGFIRRLEVIEVSLLGVEWLIWC
jgi:hypothetical protein